MNNRGSSGDIQHSTEHTKIPETWKTKTYLPPIRTKLWTKSQLMWSKNNVPHYQAAHFTAKSIPETTYDQVFLERMPVVKKQTSVGNQTKEASNIGSHHTESQSTEFDDPDISNVTPEFQPMYPGVGPFLARFLPQQQPSHLGLSHQFCDLHEFLRHLHELSWCGYMHAELDGQSAYVLVFEGRTVAAAAANATGENALGELLSLYENGASLTAYPLPDVCAHILSGVGSRAWKFNLTQDFTGLHARPTGALFYANGKIVATMAATLPYEGAFPAPLRPQTLILPRSLAGWAHQTYQLTLRGRDAINAITDTHMSFKEEHGTLGQQFLQAIAQQVSPAEYAMRSDIALHEIEALFKELKETGLIREH